MIDLIEGEYGVRKYTLPPVKYVFFNTGLEMKAAKDHVKATAEKYGVEIEEARPKISIDGYKGTTDILMWVEMEASGVYCEVIGNIHDNPELLENNTRKDKSI